MKPETSSDVHISATCLFNIPFVLLNGFDTGVGVWISKCDDITKSKTKNFLHN